VHYFSILLLPPNFEVFSSRYNVSMVRFLFIQKDHENIGIEYLSAGLKAAGFLVDLLYFPRAQEDSVSNAAILDKIATYKPDVVCFSPFSYQYQWALRKAKIVKKKFKKVFILFGGVHINSVPDLVMREKTIHGIIVGEADETIVEFAKNLEKGDVGATGSLWYRKEGKVIKNSLAPLVTDLDTLPFPDKDLFYANPAGAHLRQEFYTVVGSRGCPYACTYCSNNIYQRLYKGQKRFRQRSPENIIEELVQNKEKYNFRRVSFADDVLAIDMPRLKKLMKLYKKKVNVPFSCFFHPNLVKKETVKLLKDGGCTWFKLGIQSANEDYRREHLNRSETNKNILQVAELCRKYGLKFSFDHILQLPGETKAHLLEAVRLYSECRPTIINFWGLMYLPGTDIIQLGLKTKAISKKDIKRINAGEFSSLDIVPWYKNKNENVNASAFMTLFVIISLVPKKVINLLLRIHFYDLPFRVPNAVLVPLKVMSKVRAGQGYLYLSQVREFFTKKSQPL
jgi:anaerobic magnesium-protoporphyrin IX monomethyl ester cyclase